MIKGVSTSPQINAYNTDGNTKPSVNQDQKKITMPSRPDIIKEKIANNTYDLDMRTTAFKMNQELF